MDNYKINGQTKVIICGAGYQTETIVRYLKKNGVTEIIVLVEHYTQRPEDCFRIPSKRCSNRNSFSEVDLLMDNYVESVPVKRFDMLDDVEKSEYIFFYYSSEESQNVFKKISNAVGENYYFIKKDELIYINNNTWTHHEIIEELWNTNKYLYSEMQIVENVLRRQLKATVYDFHFEFHLVEHCNLNCAGCTHFAPLAIEEYLDINEFKHDINKLSELTGGNTRFINLLGGEPLLHPDICEFMKLCRLAFPNTLIRIVTNGIKLKEMTDTFWNACKQYSITIGITQYPIEVDYDHILSMLTTKGVDYESFSGDTYPRDEMWRLSLDETGKNRPIENFIKCPRANACIFVSHGKVFNCATMANINHFNKCFGKNYDLCDEDYVDLYKVKNVNELLEKLCNPKPFCRFCNIEKRTYGTKWELSSKNILEWS